MTKLVSLALALCALALSAWSLVAARTATTTLDFAESAYKGVLQPAAAGTAEQVESAAHAEGSERQGGEAAGRSGLAATPLMAAPAFASSSRPSDASAQGDPAPVLPSLAASPAPLPPSSSATLGYTLPQSHTASENSLSPP